MSRLTKALTSAGKFLFPKQCALCGDVLGFYYTYDLCPECDLAYRAELDKPCAVCGEICAECHCSDKHYRPFGSSRHTALGFYREYDDPVGRLVYRLKREYDRDLQKFFARSLADKIISDFGGLPGEFCLTFPPRTDKAKRKAGFDQAAQLSRYTAEFLGCPWEQIFVRIGGKMQKKLDSEDRMKNAAEMFALVDEAHVNGRKYIVIDDVMTTGATLGALAEMLYSAGAAEVYPASLFVTEPKRAKPKDSGLWFEE